jgi:hypothetical protein
LTDRRAAIGRVSDAAGAIGHRRQRLGVCVFFGRWKGDEHAADAKGLAGHQLKLELRIQQLLKPLLQGPLEQGAIEQRALRTLRPSVANDERQERRQYNESQTLKQFAL